MICPLLGDSSLDCPAPSLSCPKHLKSIALNLEQKRPEPQVAHDCSRGAKPLLTSRSGTRTSTPFSPHRAATQVELAIPATEDPCPAQLMAPEGSG